MSSEEIKQRRIALNLTQNELAERFGVEANTIARWEQGKIRPKAKGMLRLAFQSLEIEKGLSNSEFEDLRKDLVEKVKRLRVRHTKHQAEWKNLSK